VGCYPIVSLRDRVELKPLDKSPVRAEFSSVEILLVEGISFLMNYSISVIPNAWGAIRDEEKSNLKHTFIFI